MFRSNFPRALWSYGLPHFAKIMQIASTNAAGLNGRIPLGYVTSETRDISPCLDLGFYDWMRCEENASLDSLDYANF